METTETIEKHYTAYELAQLLYDKGLRKVGVLKLASCRVGDGAYVEQLRNALRSKGIEVGYIVAPVGLLQIEPFPGTNKRPVWKLNPFGASWTVMTGKLNVNFPGTRYTRPTKT